MKKDSLNIRAEKIKLLNNLRTGKTKINDIFPVLPEHWIYEKNRGIYSRGDIELNEDEFKALKKSKRENWLFSICKLNDIIGDQGKRIEIFSNCQDYKWSFDGPAPLDEKQVKKIISALRKSKINAK